MLNISVSPSGIGTIIAILLAGAALTFLICRNCCGRCQGRRQRPRTRLAGFFPTYRAKSGAMVRIEADKSGPAPLPSNYQAPKKLTDSTFKQEYEIVPPKPKTKPKAVLLPLLARRTPPPPPKSPELFYDPYGFRQQNGAVRQQQYLQPVQQLHLNQQQQQVKVPATTFFQPLQPLNQQPLNQQPLNQQQQKLQQQQQLQQQQLQQQQQINASQTYFPPPPQQQQQQTNAPPTYFPPPPQLQQQHPAVLQHHRVSQIPPQLFAQSPPLQSPAPIKQQQQQQHRFSQLPQPMQQQQTQPHVLQQGYNGGYNDLASQSQVFNTPSPRDPEPAPVYF